MELALALGMTITELLERMPHSELALWRAKWYLAPWGEKREDERHAMRLHAFVSANSKKANKFPLSEFYPFKSKTQADRSVLVRELSKAGNIVVKGPSR